MLGDVGQVLGLIEKAVEGMNATALNQFLRAVFKPWRGGAKHKVIERQIRSVGLLDQRRNKIGAIEVDAGFLFKPPACPFDPDSIAQQIVDLAEMSQDLFAFCCQVVTVLVEKANDFGLRVLNQLCNEFIGVGAVDNMQTINKPGGRL